MKHHPHSVALALDDWRSAVAALDYDPSNNVRAAIVTTRQRHKEAVKASLKVIINPDPPRPILATAQALPVPFYAKSVDDLWK